MRVLGGKGDFFFCPAGIPGQRGKGKRGGKGGGKGKPIRYLLMFPRKKKGGKKKNLAKRERTRG